MESLIQPLLILSPILAFVGLYRLWCLINRKFEFKNKAVGITYALILIPVMSSYIYYGWHYFKCVWPGHCGEGFASGYISAGIILCVLVTTVIYIFSEIILFLL